MKKLIVFGVLIIMGYCTTFAGKDITSIYTMYPSASVSFYVDSDINNYPSYVTSVKNGNGEILSCNALVADSVERKLIGVKGKSLKLDGTIGDYNAVKEKLNVKEVSNEKLNEIYITYGYMVGEDKHVFVEGKKVNVQIAYNNGKIIIGFPLILGSY